MTTLVDMAGLRFGRLTVVARAPRPAHRRATAALWECTCDCGASVVLSGDGIRRGNNVSCGCYHRQRLREVPLTHGMSYADEYRILAGMIMRCHNPNVKAYIRYGGRGIVVCDEWRGPGGFERFLSHVGSRPTDRHPIDRIDNDRGYEPGNVRWATATQQARNTSNSRLIRFGSETKTIAEWSELTGVRSGTLLSRLKAGWTIEQTLTTQLYKGVNRVGCRGQR